MRLLLIAFLSLFAIAAAPAAAQHNAFPGAAGWAAQTPGGRGGAIVRVTNLDASGPGSLRAALERKGPRIVVFEVGGVIDLGRTTLAIREPFLTIAGQTAPSPGITIVRGGIDIRTHDVIVRHIRIHTGVDGQRQRSGWEADALATVAAANVIVDHCTLIWGIDENLSASGPRFAGSAPEEWRRGTSRNVTFSYNIIAEGLRHASHPKGEHSKGSLIHDNATGILIYRNLYAHNMQRNPLLKGGAQAAVVNNLIYNPGVRGVHYNLLANEWGDNPYQVGELAAVGNVLRAGADSQADMAFLAIGGAGDLRFHGRDNVALRRDGRPMPMFGRYTMWPARILAAPRPQPWPEGLDVLPAKAVEAHVLASAGARPWDRDAHERRITADAARRRGRIIDDEREVGGYLRHAATRAPFREAEWDLPSMEPKSGRYPGSR
jgi:pectate lyase